MLRAALICLALLAAGSAGAQDTRDLGLPPPSGSQNPVLPPPSGSQNPILPPQSGQRYMPGVGGPFSGDDDIPGSGYRRTRPPRESSSGEIGVAGGLAPSTKPFEGEALARLTDIAPALRRCWHPPVIDGLDTGVMATVRFSLRRDGSLFGQPRVTWETRRTDPALRQRFTDSVVAAVRDCTPMRLSPQLGASIAGRPFSIRFHGRAPSTERQI
jgi:hypothetical protein